MLSEPSNRFHIFSFIRYARSRYHTGPDTQNDDFARFFAEGVQAVMDRMRPPTQADTLAICRELTDHLAAYVHDAANFDEDSHIAVGKAERHLPAFTSASPTRHDQANA